MFIAQEKKISPNKVTSRKFLTNISYNRLKHVDFDNTLFIIGCFMYILFKLNVFFLERKFDNEYNRDCVRMLWTYLVPNEFYIFICKHDSFNVLNKLSLKYQNASEIINDFIVEHNISQGSRNTSKEMHRFLNTLAQWFFQNISVGWITMVAFDIAYGGYKNEQENIHFLPEMLIK